MAKQYVIIEAPEVDSVDFNQVMETSADTVRYSVDGSKSFVKFEGPTPAFLAGKEALSHSEILEVLAGPDWAAPEPPM